MFLTTPGPGKRAYIYLGLLLILCFLTELFGFIVSHAFHVNANPLINIFILTNFPLIVLNYKDRIHWQSVDKIAYAIIAASVLFVLFNIVFVHGFFKVSTYSISVQAVGTIVVSLLYFYVLIQQLPTESITKLPMFWINTAMLIYHSGIFLIFLSADYLTTVLGDNFIVYLSIHHVIALIYYALLFYALRLIRSEYKSSPSPGQQK